MAKIIKMMFYLVFIGELVINVISIYNPLLTYALRFKKVQVYPNITCDYYTIDRSKGGEYLVNGQFTINSKEQINKVVVVFHRCDPDGINCEYFQSWALTNICSKLKDKDQVWTRWYNSFEPPMVCPLDKVHYKIRNGTFDIGMALVWYPFFTDYQWKVLQKIYSDDIFIGSYLLDISIFSYRKKTKNILKL